MKKFKKLIPAFCAMLVSAAMLGTSTYAWFSVNKEVTATGMSVTALTDTQYFVVSATTGFTTDTTVTLTESDNKVVPVAFTKSAITSSNASAGTVAKNNWYTATVDTYDGKTEQGGSKYSKLTTIGAATTAENCVYTKAENVGNGKYFVEYTFYVGLASTSADFNGYLKFTAKEGTKGVNIAGVSVQSSATSSTTEVVALADYVSETDTENKKLGFTANQYKLVASPAQYVTVKVYAYIDGTKENVKDSNIAKADTELKGSISLTVKGYTATEYADATK